MDESAILNIVTKYNPWWIGKEMPKSELMTYKRRIFYPLVKEFDKEKITVILGPRRVGKTVLLHQLIKHLLDNKIAPKNILYLSLDRDEFSKEKVTINDILNVYYKSFLKRPMDDQSEKVYIFLDEVSKTERYLNFKTLIKR